MQRRDFLKLICFSLILMLGNHPQALMAASGAKKGRKNKKILVVGAGLAGLAAAQKLQAAGYEVVVLEARERIGGRTWTSTKWPDVPLDMGASWIHGVEENPLTALADELGARRALTSYAAAVVYSTEGQPLNRAAAQELDILREELAEAIATAQNAETDQSLLDIAAQYARLRHASPELRRLISFTLNGNIEHEYAGPADEMSAYWFDHGKNYDGEDAVLADGFKVIVDHLAQGLDIQLGQVVKKVRWRGGVQEVETSQGVFAADHVLITVPLGVLQAGTVEFSPPLPEAKQAAIRQLGMGVLNKCYLRFDQTFWPEDVDWLEYISEKHGEWTEWVSFKRALDKPILLGFNAAHQGRAIEKWSDAQIVESAMQTLRRLFGQTIPDPVDYQLTRWASDPFARGAYSYNRLGSHPRQRGQLAQAEGSLFFAGEATHEHYFGTAHGAFLSGLSAARNIMEKG